jgi:hypothetical protein
MGSGSEKNSFGSTTLVLYQYYMGKIKYSRYTAYLHVPLPGRRPWPPVAAPAVLVSFPLVFVPQPFENYRFSFSLITTGTPIYLELNPKSEPHNYPF